MAKWSQQENRYIDEELIHCCFFPSLGKNVLKLWCEIKQSNIKKTQTRWSSRHQRDWLSSPFTFCNDLCSGRMSEEWMETQLLSQGSPAHGCILPHKVQSSEKSSLVLLVWKLLRASSDDMSSVVLHPVGLTRGGSCTNPTFCTPRSDSPEQHRLDVTGWMKKINLMRPACHKRHFSSEAHGKDAVILNICVKE